MPCSICRHTPHPDARLHARLGGRRRRSAEGRVRAVDALGDERTLSVRRARSEGAVELLCSGFKATTPDILTITPADAETSAIGHLGFFRPEHRDTLWRGAAEWLEAEGEAAAGCRSGMSNSLPSSSSRLHPSSVIPGRA